MSKEPNILLSAAAFFVYLAVCMFLLLLCRYLGRLL